MSHMGMDHEQHMGHGDPSYHDGQQWMEPQQIFHTPQHQSPAQEYGGFNFTPMPMEPMYGGMPPPPRTTHQQLQPLIMPQQMPQWPSQMTSQSTYMAPTYSTMPMPMAQPMTSPAATAPGGSIKPPPTPRKTLTDDDRKRMCQYAAENPNVKQTEIGKMFGVERSTVSKVLRQKEKYLYQEDGSRSPARKQKGKFPDIERALMNWIRNQHKQGLPITDAAIKEKARFFATTVGSPESHQKANSTSWLEKFKHKNNIGTKSRKSSLAGESEASNPASGTQSPSNISPVSPTGSPVDLDVKLDEVVKTETDDGFTDFTHGHRPFHSASNPALPSVFHSQVGSTFSPAPASPTSPFYTPDSASGPSPFVPIQPRDGPQPRPRSQTFPVVGSEPFSPPSSGTMTPKYFQAPVFDSPIHDFSVDHSAIDEMIAEPSSTTSSVPPTLLAPSESGSVIASPPLPSNTTRSSLPLSIPASTAQAFSSPVTPASMSSPSSPTNEDARRALETLMNFFHQQPSGFAEPQDYITMGKLMQKLELRSRQNSQDAGVVPHGHGLGLMRPSLSRSGTSENLASIPEGHM